MENIEKTIPSASGGSQKISNPPSSSTRISGRRRAHTFSISNFTRLFQQVITEIRGAPQGRLSKLSQKVITEICNSDDNSGSVPLPPEPQEGLCKLSQRIITEICETSQEKLSEPAQQVITLLAKRVITQLSPQEITEIRKSQKEKTFKLIVQQIIPKICSFADGISLALDANGFKITKDILDTFSNAVRFIVHIIVTRRTSPEANRSFKDYFYKVEKKDNVEKKEIIFKRLVMAAASACKVLSKLMPTLTCLQALSKLLPYVSLSLDIIELGFNYETFIKDGFTRENVLKIVAALSYHAISCAAFVMASSGVIFACVLLTQLGKFFNLLVAGGMKDAALIVQPLDKLLFSNKLADNVCSFIESIWSDQNIADEDISQQITSYLSLIGFQLC
jgi:Na+-transporting NADH:ubiquinone oxidoreductase subunit NqrD